MKLEIRQEFCAETGLYRNMTNNGLAAGKNFKEPIDNY
jgi:hypothetical protein